MKALTSLCLAATLSLACISTAAAGKPLPTVVPAGGVGPGPWIVGGVAISAFSLIVCSKVVGDRRKREMTHQEAMTAMILPFSCLVQQP